MTITLWILKWRVYFLYITTLHFWTFGVLNNSIIGFNFLHFMHFWTSRFLDSSIFLFEFPSRVKLWMRSVAIDHFLREFYKYSQLVRTIRYLKVRFHSKLTFEENNMILVVVLKWFFWIYFLKIRIILSIFMKKMYDFASME